MRWLLALFVILLIGGLAALFTVGSWGSFTDAEIRDCWLRSFGTDRRLRMRQATRVLAGSEGVPAGCVPEGRALSRDGRVPEARRGTCMIERSEECSSEAIAPAGCVPERPSAVGATAECLRPGVGRERLSTARE